MKSKKQDFDSFLKFLDTLPDDLVPADFLSAQELNEVISVSEQDASQTIQRKLKFTNKYMQDYITYLDKTESAVKNIFDGMEYYQKILDPIKGTTYVGGGANKQEAEKNFNQWAEKNQGALIASIEAQKKFFEESFAMATLCGAVLQIAAKAIECFSPQDHVPENLSPIIGDSKAIRKFCIGREVKGLPIGLIIYAGRNQHTHYNDPKLSAANTAIFSKLAEVPGHPDAADPALDLRRPNILSLADNITFILGWRTYKDYRMDMEILLNIKPD